LLVYGRVATLAYLKGNKTKAADILGIGRKTLQRKLAEGKESRGRICQAWKKHNKFTDPC
jgi:predicted DNA-binding protein (UPF0251 family)